MEFKNRSKEVSNYWIHTNRVKAENKLIKIKKDLGIDYNYCNKKIADLSERLRIYNRSLNFQGERPSEHQKYMWQSLIRLINFYIKLRASL